MQPFGDALVLNDVGKPFECQEKSRDSISSGHSHSPDRCIPEEVNKELAITQTCSKSGGSAAEQGSSISDCKRRPGVGGFWICYDTRLYLAVLLGEVRMRSSTASFPSSIFSKSNSPLWFSAIFPARTPTIHWGQPACAAFARISARTKVFRVALSTLCFQLK